MIKRKLARIPAYRAARLGMGCEGSYIAGLAFQILASLFTRTIRTPPAARNLIKSSLEYMEACIAMKLLLFMVIECEFARIPAYSVARFGMGREGSHMAGLAFQILASLFTRTIRTPLAARNLVKSSLENMEACIAMKLLFSFVITWYLSRIPPNREGRPRVRCK
jgi:hypothetical protein